MSLEDDALYEFSACYLRLTPLNDDLSQPVPGNIIGGVGPFDFTNVSVIAAVPVTSKIDSGAAENDVVDLSLAVDQGAVTAAEIFAAINVAAITDVTASLEVGTNRLKIVFASGTIAQFYGELAELSDIGQGKGIRVVTTNTFKSFTDNPIRKDSENFTTTTVKGTDIEVTSDAYRKGTNGSYVDSAIDYVMRSIVEGGSIDATTGKYSVPTSLSRTIYFKVEVFWGKYAVGVSLEADIAGYTHQTIYLCSGSYGDKTRDRNMTDTTYNYIATPPKLLGVIQPDSDELPLTVAEFLALDIEGVSVA